MRSENMEVLLEQDLRRLLGGDRGMSRALGYVFAQHADRFEGAYGDQDLERRVYRELAERFHALADLAPRTGTSPDTPMSPVQKSLPETVLSPAS